MHQPRHSLHHPVPIAHHHKTMMERILSALKQTTEPPAVAPGSHTFPITTVSMNYNFDAYIRVGFKGAHKSTAPHLIVDSGNTSLIVPHWEDIAAIANYEAHYQVLGQLTEPWGCPANVVKGPIELFNSEGHTFTIDDCIFFACTADSPTGHRTENFGTGCIDPWSASTANVLPHLGITLQPILSQTPYPYVTFEYAPMDPAQLAAPTTAAHTRSVIRISATPPEGFEIFDLIPNCAWMSVTPTGLSIAGSPTQWPGSAASPIAMVDTGGGPVHLTDPNGYLVSSSWPNPVPNPAWASDLEPCQSIQAPLEISLSDKDSSYNFIIDNRHFPADDKGLTLVMAANNPFMRGEQGMNLGGISALVNQILVDFKNKKVGFKRI
jgi:hypothetical protein